MVLQGMLQMHLKSLFRSCKSPSSIESKDLTPERWARMSNLTRLSKAKLRKLTGQAVGSLTKITKDEIMALSHCCLGPGCFLKQAKFIIEYNAKHYRRCIQVPHKAHRVHFSSALQKKCTPMPMAVVRLANKMSEYVDESYVPVL